MFQLHRLNRDLIPGLLASTCAQDPLEDRVDRIIVRLREARRREAAGRGLATRLAVGVDGWLRTDAPEFLDLPDYADAAKVDIVTRLDRLNRALHAYRRFFALLRPAIAAAYRRERRPVRILELASGSGSFTVALARQARAAGLPVEVHGSDYLAAHVRAGERRAAAAGLAVPFRQVNAFDMDNVAEGEFDLIFLAQTMHHFSPGQLARMVEQSVHKAPRFVGIDVRRSLHVWGIVPAMAALSPHWGFLHDGIVSIRKMYSEPELALIAQLAAPGHAVRTRGAFPGYSVLEVTRANAG